MGRGGGWDGREGKGGEGGVGGGERMWRGPESGLPRGPCWFSAGLITPLPTPHPLFGAYGESTVLDPPPFENHGSATARLVS